MFGDQRFRVVGGALHSGQGGGVADVAQGDADVAQQSAPLRPRNRRDGKFLFETGVIKGEELDQIRLSQIRPCVFLHELARASEPVPRTNREAIVAAIDPIADGWAEFDRDRAFQFNGQIGNAEPRIELERAGDRPGRAGLQTTGAGATAIPFWRVRLQFQRRDDFAEENPIAEPAADEIGVFADEAEAGALRQVAFEQRTRVHIPEGARPCAAKPVHKFGQ